MLTLALLSALFFALALSLAIADRQRWLALASAIAVLLWLLLCIVWIISDQFTGEGFNSAVVYHLRVGFEGGGISEYAGVVAATFVLIALALLATTAFAWRLFKNPAPQRTGRSYVFLLALLALCVLHPTSNTFLASFNSAIYGPDSLFGRWRLAEGPQETPSRVFGDFYRIPDIAKVDARQKNLVVLYAESLERTYFDKELFPGLITELRALEDRAISFTNIGPVRGTGFTIAGLVASQCGIPLITSGHPNSMRGMAEFLPGATCMGDLLKAQAYQLHYLGGASLSFAGKGKFFATHGFDSIQGLDELRPQLEDPDYVSTWGLYDDALLELFFERFESLSAAGQPFGLFGLTMDTHHPHGHQSRSCQDLEYADGSNSMLNAVKCSDRLIARLITAILASPWAEDTVLVLASDHLAMNNDAHEQLLQGERRNLLWIFPDNEAEPRRIASRGTTLDSAATIMYQLGLVDSAFGLGRNLLRGDSSLITSMPRFPWQLREWRQELAAFWQLPDSIQELKITDQGSRLSIDGRNYETPALLSLRDGAVEQIRFEFDSRVKLPSYIAAAQSDETVLWIDSCQRVRAMDLTLPKVGACAFVGRIGARDAQARVLSEDLSLRGAEISALAAQSTDQNTYARRQRSIDSLQNLGEADIRQYAVSGASLPNLEHLEIKSSGGPGSLSYVEIGSHKQTLARGLNLLSVTTDGIELVSRLDGCAPSSSTTPKLSSVVDELSTPPRVLLLVAHDSASCGEPLNPYFAGVGLERWEEIALRTPYAAIFVGPVTQKPLLEVVGDPMSSVLVSVKEQTL